MKRFKQFISESVNAPKDDTEYTMDEAAKHWGIEKKNVVLSNRIVKKRYVWINDLTSETVYAKMKNVKQDIKKYFDDNPQWGL
jgi:hypothetical protein